MITTKQVLKKCEAEIQECINRGWGRGDAVRIAKKYGYSPYNIWKKRRKLADAKKD